MNSNFKFVQSVNPKQIPPNAVRPKFSKLTLATTKTVAVQSTDKDLNTGAEFTRTITHTTTKRATLTEPMNDDGELESEPACAQKPRILLCESTVGQEDASNSQQDILTDDDTLGSISIDSQEIEAGLKELSQPTQEYTNVRIDESEPIISVPFDNAPSQPIEPTELGEFENPTESLYPVKALADIESIDTQMRSLSFISPFFKNDRPQKVDENVQRLSHQLESLDLVINNRASQEMPLNTTQVDRKSLAKKEHLNYSIQTLSSTTESVDNKLPSAARHSKHEVIILSDSESEMAIQPNINKAPAQPATEPSDNDGAVYNTSSLVPKAIADLDSEVLSKLNRFFDNAPFTEAAENSFNTTPLSNSVHDVVYVGETTDEESAVEKTVSEVSEQVNEPEQQVNTEETNVNTHQNGISERQTEISDNNIVVDIPVIKSSSDQPPQVIRSHSAVRLKASNSSPIIKLNSIDGQVNISAKININIQIAPITDSSSDTSSDKSSKSSKSGPVASSGDPNSNDDANSNEMPVQVKLEKKCKITKAEASNAGYDDIASGTSKNSSLPKSPFTPARKKLMQCENVKTPSTASKLKGFEFQAPRSMTKTKPPIESPKTAKKNSTPVQHEAQAKSSNFQIDNNIAVSAEHQRLLYKVYGDDWKTPEVIRSYALVKNKSVDRVNGESTPAINHNRHSRGFHMFKRNISENLDSTRIEGIDEISIIEQPDQKKNRTKSVRRTPQSRKLLSTPKEKPESKSTTKKNPKNKPISPSVFTKRPIDNDESSLIRRPKRNVARKKLAISSDSEDDDKENDFNGDSSDEWVVKNESDDSDMMTDDDSDSDYSESTQRTKGSRSCAPRTAKKKNRLTYLNLSDDEVIEVEDGNKTQASEDDLANITRRFLEADLNDDTAKPKIKAGRKLYNKSHNYPDSDAEDNDEEERRKAREAGRALKVEESVDIPIPFTHKLFDGKSFGSPSTNKTPKPKARDEFKTPAPSTKKIAERKTPFVTKQDKLLDDPPKQFKHYTFLRSLDVLSTMLYCHPDAKKFRDNFKSHKEELTSILFKMYNEQVFDGKLDMKVEWNKKLLTTAGRFIGSSKPAIKPNRIELSEKVLTSADRLRCTLIHEMCHAATWIFDKDKGHGIKWKTWAKKSNNTFPELPTISVCHNYNIEYKYAYKCDMCNAKAFSHSKSKKAENIRCSHCHGSISIFLNKKQGNEYVLVPVRKANGFANFVKEKYKDFKKPGVTHAEVMRLISTQFATLSHEEKKKY